MIALVLHAGVERDHREIVGVRDCIDISCKAKRKRRKRHNLRKPAAGGRAFYVKSRPAGRLADAADNFLAELAEPLHKSERRRCFSFAKSCGRDGGNIDIFPFTPCAYAFKDLGNINLCENVAIRRPFVISQIEFFGQICSLAKVSFGGFGNLPILHFCRV